MCKSARECGIAVVDNVASRTVPIRCNMTLWFTFADIAIMTGQTVTGVCRAVIKCHIRKVSNNMADRAILVVGIGRYVIRQFTYTNNIVVARITSGNTGMIIGASTKGARGMAIAAILVTGRTRKIRIGWHVRIERCGKWFACGSNLWWYWAVIAMACLAIVHDTGMIKDSISKAFCIVTPTTIFSSVSMCLSICRRCGINARAYVMARLTRLT
jgi:hypothetical protein